MIWDLECRVATSKQIYTLLTVSRFCRNQSENSTESPTAHPSASSDILLKSDDVLVNPNASISTEFASESFSVLMAAYNERKAGRNELQDELRPLRGNKYGQIKPSGSHRFKLATSSCPSINSTSIYSFVCTVVPMHSTVSQYAVPHSDSESDVPTRKIRSIGVTVIVDVSYGRFISQGSRAASN